MINFWASSADETEYKLSRGGGVVLPLKSYTGKLCLKGVPFFRLQAYERVGISLVEVFKRVGKSVIWVCEMAQRAEQMNFMTL